MDRVREAKLTRKKLHNLGGVGKRRIISLRKTVLG